MEHFVVCGIPELLTMQTNNQPVSVNHVLANGPHRFYYLDLSKNPKRQNRHNPHAVTISFPTPPRPPYSAGPYAHTPVDTSSIYLLIFLGALL
jgi:hypothetical protein